MSKSIELIGARRRLTSSRISSALIQGTKEKMTGKRFAMLCCAAVATVVCVSLAAVMLSMPQLQATPKLVLVTGGQDPYQQAVALGAEAAAKARDVELEIVQLGHCDVGTASAMLNSLVRDGVSGVVISRSVN